jgi:hypothetical protein
MIQFRWNCGVRGHNWRGRGRAGRADFYASFIFLPSACSLRFPNKFHFGMDDRGLVAFEYPLRKGKL